MFVVSLMCHSSLFKAHSTGFVGMSEDPLHMSRYLPHAVEVKPEAALEVDPVSPLDLRKELRMLGPGADPGMWERQLQQELLLIQKQQQIQKQLLITEFQKQHENLSRQHQAQLQEHLKVSPFPPASHCLCSGTLCSIQNTKCKGQ